MCYLKNLLQRKRKGARKGRRGKEGNSRENVGEEDEYIMTYILFKGLNSRDSLTPKRHTLVTFQGMK